MQVILDLDDGGEGLAGVADVIGAFVDRHQDDGITISLGNGAQWWEVMGRPLSPEELKKLRNRLAALVKLSRNTEEVSADPV